MSANAATRFAVTAEPRPWRRALLWLALLGPLFFLTYGFANWAAAQHEEVGHIVFDWERQIPFLPWTILPYWSIDLLYGLSLFVCSTRKELDMHARRLLTAQVICITAFLAWPLHFTFTRPPSDGLYGAMFDLLMGFDQPFNQAPSLHIVLLIVLWSCYAHHVHGWPRRVLDAWFALIGVSVLTTYQHHFVDIPTGLAAGWLCLWLWPRESESPLAQARLTRDPQRLKLAARYLVGAGVLAAFAWWLRGWALWLLWPAAALALVAAAYALFGAHGFQKSGDGRMTTAVLWLYGPYLLGAWINSRLWTRRRPQPDLVRDGVWLGRLPGARDLRTGSHVAIVDLCAELPLAPARQHYTALPQLDLVAAEPAELLAAARAIEAARAAGPVLVCCALGYSRSAAAVAAWLLVSRRASSPTDAVEQIRAARPGVVLSPAHQTALVSIYSASREAA